MNKKRRRTNVMPEHLRVKAKYGGYVAYNIIVSRDMYGKFYETIYDDRHVKQKEISELDAQNLIIAGYIFYDALKDTENAYR